MASIAVTVAAKSSFFEQTHPPSIPVTSAQWKSALCEIKLLYIQKQYKRCVARSSCILAKAREPMNPIYKIYLHFYSAICYEAMGVYAHEYSSKKVPLLHKTLDCPDDDPFLSDLDSEGIVESEDYNLIYKIDGEDPEPELESEREYLLVPSPLQVCKSKSSTPFPTLPLSFNCNGKGSTIQTQQSHLWAKFAFASEIYPQPRPLPPFLLPLSIDMDPNSTATLNSTDGDFRDGAYAYYPERNTIFRSLSASSIKYSHEYNNNLSFLHTRITNTITHLQNLIQDVTAAQKAHNTSRQSVSGGLQRSTSFWSFSPIKNKEWKNMNESNPSTRQLPLFQQRKSLYSSCFRRESMRDRIARLRAQGWETVGLKNPERGWKGADYYRGFCEMVLDELYLG
ncbi:hypothetical protein BDW72DRAFT_212308 [Aspergillus terricola var. indicus]